MAWVVAMGAVINRAYFEAGPATLAADLARYGSTAVWSGVYYRGEKIGFTVSQLTRKDDGFELQEDGRLQMLLLGQDTAAKIRTTARTDANFALRSFDFSLDPGTGAIDVRGTITPPAAAGGLPRAESRGAYRLTLAITSSGATRTEVRDLPEAPVISQNLSRLLATGRLVPGSRHTFSILDPATLHNAPAQITVGDRTVVRTGDSIVPAFAVEMDFQGLRTTSWVTDTGDVIKEESPLGLMTIRESRERAQGLAVPRRVREDLLNAAAVVPVMRQRIDEPRDVRRLVLRLDGVDLPDAELDGVGQHFDGRVLDISDARAIHATRTSENVAAYLAGEPLIQSDAPEIVAEAQKAIAIPGGTPPDSPRERAERLTRYVNALIDKKPTVSIPSALDVLRTKVGDCNEHTALFVAMARALGIPARIAVGLVFMRGAFYYHAWPEVYLKEGGSGLWLPVDPTLNQFPVDATHVRLARGGLEKQTAIVPLVGRLKMTVLDVQFAPESERVLVGRSLESSLANVPIPVPATTERCRCDK